MSLSAARTERAHSPSTWLWPWLAWVLALGVSLLLVKILDLSALTGPLFYLPLGGDLM